MSVWLWLFLAHWVGDFVFQTDWQAKNKWHRWDALLQHGCTYAVPMTCWALLVSDMAHPFYWLWINLVLHLVTDAVTSQATHRFSEALEWHMFFVVVGADQAIHYGTMVATWFWLAS